MNIPLDWLVLLTFAVTFITGIVSGLSGGGAGFVTTPYYILIGLTPQEAVATGKMGGIGISFGSIGAFRGKGLVHKKYLGALLGITIACALVAAWLLPRLDSSILQQVIGWVLIILSPTLFINKGVFKPGKRSRGWIVAGFIAYTFITFAQTMMGTGIGTLLVLILMFLFGLSALEANATKRVAQVSQAVILFVLLLVQGLVIVSHGIAAMIGSWIGGHIGSKIALKKGSGFVKLVLAVVMVISGVSLLVV
jgi:uncharacterized protein